MDSAALVGLHPQVERPSPRPPRPLLQLAERGRLCEDPRTDGSPSASPLQRKLHGWDFRD